MSRSGGVTGAGSTIGQHADEVLASPGYGTARIADLWARNIIGG